ncbi:MAG: hypothetical protein O3C28_13250 [Proteobacteria bacterium]|nr:hypothetical protein [Pseudomonadota bacterium]
MKLLRWIGYGLISLIVLIGILLVGARFADGPIEIIAGGPFRSGDIATGAEPDWLFVRDVDTVELQLLSPARSRTTWIVEHDNKIYIPCGYMNTAWGKLWKRWPIEAEQDGRAILRVDGKLYERHLVRLKTGDALQAVVSTLSEKYQVPATVEAVNNNSLWIFALEPVS